MSRNEDQFLVQLITLDEEMGTDDIHLLKFICRDHIGKSKLEKMSSALNIFRLLKEKTLIMSGDDDFLLECLGLINRYDLIEKLGFDDIDNIKTQLSSFNRISPFRKLQVEVAEELDESELNQLKDLLKGIVPRRRVRESRTVLDLFIFMEQEYVLAPQKTELLMVMLRAIKRTDLVCKIQEYSEISVHAAYRQTVPSCCVKIIRTSSQVDITSGLSQQDEVLADRFGE